MTKKNLMGNNQQSGNEFFKQHLENASKRFEALPDWQKHLLGEQVGLQSSKKRNSEK